MPSSFKPCSVSRFAGSQILLIITKPSLKLLSWPTYPVSRVIPELHSTDHHIVLRVRNGRRDRFRADLQRCWSGALSYFNRKTFLELPRCRSVVWQSLQRFSNRFSIRNFEIGFMGLDQMRYSRNPHVKRFISRSSAPDYKEDPRIRKTRRFIATRSAEARS